MIGYRMTEEICTTLQNRQQAEPPHTEQEQVGDDQAPVDGVDELGVLLKHERAGIMPWTTNAPMSSAAAMLPGMPRVKSGMRLDATTALLADSEAAMPSSLPLPKVSGFL